ADGFAELAAFIRVTSHHLENATGHTDAACTNMSESHGRHALHDKLEACPHLAQYVACRNPTIRKGKLGMAIAAMSHHWLTPRHGEAGRPLVDQQEGNASPCTLRLVGEHHHDHVVSNIAVADEMLGAVDHPFVATHARRPCNRRGI